MRKTLHKPSSLKGTVSPPGDKSISHRALILNAMAQGSATITGLSSGEDVLSTMHCLRLLGVRIENHGEGRVAVNGSGDAMEEPEDVLDTGNSGTSMRLLAGMLAGQPLFSVLTGDSSLRSRPMGRVVEPLTLMGAKISGRKNGTQAPLVISGGSLKGVEYTMPVASAQVKSSIMLAGLSAQGKTVIHQPAHSRDHTERMLGAMGVAVETDGLSLILSPGQLSAVDVTVPGDVSSAAFWMVAGLCHPNAEVTIQGIGLNPSRCGILEALEGMGARISRESPRLEGGEPVADLLVKSTDLEATEVGKDLVPRIIDEIPILAVAACFARGTTYIRDAQELRFKESDRIQTTVKELSRLGASIEELPDGMVIHGTGTLTGARCRSYGDHRLAMALCVAGLLSEGETTIDGAQAANVSYPQFWDHLQGLTGEGPEPAH